MGCSYKAVIAFLLVSFTGSLHANPVNLADPVEVKTESPIIREVVKDVSEGGNGPPTKNLTKELTLVHGYNDTEYDSGSQNATSKFSLSGGLVNQILNSGGVQKTIVNNQIQYNFYFWLLPKDFNLTAWRQRKT